MAQYPSPEDQTKLIPLKESSRKYINPHQNLNLSEKYLDLLSFNNVIPIKPTTILCYRSGCCPTCPPASCSPCYKSLGVECGGRHDVEITVNPRIDMKEIDACVRCCTSCCQGTCCCSRCLASPPHNKRPCDAGVPCLPIAPRLPVPFGLRCSDACPSPPCVPSPCPPVSGSPCCPSKCPPC